MFINVWFIVSCVFATNKDKINKYRACVTDSYLEVTVTTFQ